MAGHYRVRTPPSTEPATGHAVIERSIDGRIGRFCVWQTTNLP